MSWPAARNWLDTAIVPPRFCRTYATASASEDVSLPNGVPNAAAVWPPARNVPLVAWSRVWTDQLVGAIRSTAMTAPTTSTRRGRPAVAPRR
jgi:hypothetical protein